MLKPSDIGGFLLGLLIVGAVLVLVVLRVTWHGAPRPPAHPPPAVQAQTCDPPAWRAAADANRTSLNSLQWSPFGVPETGWSTYAPLVAREIGATCPPETAGFAQRYAAWQAQQGRPADGVFKAEDFDRLRDALALRRPFVQATARGECPASPPEAMLAVAGPDETFGGKVVRLRPGALAAYRRMTAAAHAAGVGVRPPLLRLISGYRGPEEEAARCADGGCDKLARAHCSAHRTGLALDLYLEPAPGADPVSSAEENRRHMAETPEYRWLAAHAQGFGFLPYAYEPWHWEWTGEPP